MKVSPYEELLCSVKMARIHAEGMNEVVAFLKAHPHEGVTIKEIGLAVFGDAYKQNRDPDAYLFHEWKARSLAAHLGWLLQYLHLHEYIKIEIETTNEPVFDSHGNIVFTNKIETVRKDNGESPYIKVTDSLGRTFEVANPFYSYSYDYQTTKKIVYKKIKRIYWADKKE